ncbi:MAG TPA: polysaccharide deacetylase family protein [Steroidobacteraceae bacterium]|nr:polysaccharide deacetylase family protein [Steroidobacteraceae bacterium]
MSAASNKVAPRRRWRPSPLVAASFAAHAAAAGAVVLRPGLWPWALGGLVADHALLTAAGLWPRSSLLGANWTRLPPPAAGRREVAITIDDGPDPDVTPGLLEILEQRRVRATFFCIGERVAANPELARDIVRRGHAIENHSLRHLYRFPLLGPRAMADEISSAQRIIESAVGAAPRFFRAPAGLRNPFLDPILARLGLQLASWTRRGFDTVTERPGVVLDRLTRRLEPGDILLLHDGNAARMPNGRPVTLEVLPALLDAIAAASLTPVALRGVC